VNPTRLFVLGALARHGPMYGHQIRRDARIDRTELWSEVKPGSLYAALHRLQGEGLIEPVRTEQQGNLPARTVYAITAEGRRELRALRGEALREVALRPDPVDLALVVVPAARVPAVIAECRDAGVPAAYVISSGFDEALQATAGTDASQSLREALCQPEWPAGP